MAPKPHQDKQAALPRARASARAAAEPSEQPMSAILVVLVFLVVMFALNRYEFGRFD
jgi:ribose/xylose/arabinose/galactoside ABC-type transport system permease subunit